MVAVTIKYREPKLIVGIITMVAIYLLHIYILSIYFWIGIAISYRFVNFNSTEMDNLNFPKTPKF